MKKQKVFWAWVVVIGLFLGITLMSGQAMAAVTIGDVINELAAALNMPVADLIAVLYPGGFNAAAPVTAVSISQLYGALNNAITDGKISGNAGNAATLITNAAGKAGAPEGAVMAGISQGTSLPPAAGGRGGASGTGSGTPGGGGGGGGGAVSPSR